MLAALLLATAPLLTATTEPPGADGLAVQWFEVRAEVGTMRAAVARPDGRGPFPTVVLLHGTHGFAREYVEIAEALARKGVLAIAPCWFAGGSGAGAGVVTPIACTDAAPMPAAASDESRRIVDALVAAVRTLPDVQPDAVALFGQSRGAGTALHAMLGGADVQALVLNSSGYPPAVLERASTATRPVLILHGATDGPATPGGSEMTTAARAQAFEAALRKAGRAVEAHYYERGGHTSLFTDGAQRADTVDRIAAFLRTLLTTAKRTP
jgi:carboxymethylenebutenolidase